jgi:hypothetical protein
MAEPDSSTAIRCVERSLPCKAFEEFEFDERGECDDC